MGGGDPRQVDQLVEVVEIDGSSVYCCDDDWDSPGGGAGAPAHGRTAAAVRDALVEVCTAMPAGVRRSLTWDQGTELSAHADLTRILSLPVFFCHPHSPWERGSNENMNGLLRDYFPKGTELATHPAKRLREVAAELNNRPRKTLNWATPAAHTDKQAAPPPSASKSIVMRR